MRNMKRGTGLWGAIVVLMVVRAILKRGGDA